MKDLVSYIYKGLESREPEELFSKAASRLPWFWQRRRSLAFDAVYDEFHRTHPWQVLIFAEQALRHRHSSAIALRGAKLAKKLGKSQKARELLSSVRPGNSRTLRRAYQTELIDNELSSNARSRTAASELAGMLTVLRRVSDGKLAEQLEVLCQVLKNRSQRLVRKGLLSEALGLLQEGLAEIRLQIGAHSLWQKAAFLRQSTESMERLITDLQSSLRWLKNGLGEPSGPASTTPTKNAVRRLLYLTFGNLPLQRNGNSVRTHGLLSALVDAGWEVDCLTRPGFGCSERALRHAGVELKSSPVPSGRTYAWENVRYTNLVPVRAKTWWLNYEAHFGLWLEGVLQAARSCKPAFLHGASNFIIGAATVHAAQKLGLPSIYEVRGMRELDWSASSPDFQETDECRWMKTLELEVAHKATHVFTISKLLAEELVTRGLPTEKITILPNAVNPEIWQPVAADRMLQDHLGLAGKFVIGFIGRVAEYEGLELLLEALSILVGRGKNPKLVIVGDGPHLGSILHGAQKLGLGAHLVHVPPVAFDKVRQYYSLFDLVVFPRRPLKICELVTPMKPYEAMAMAKPVIASDVQALKQIVQDGVTGLLFEKGNSASLAQAIEQMMDDVALRQRLGQTAREFVLEHHTWPQVVRNQVLPIYQALSGTAAWATPVSC